LRTPTCRRLVLVVAIALPALAVACTSTSRASTTPTASSTPVARPTSTGELSILEPKNGQLIHGTSVVLKVSLKSAQLVPATTTHIVPNQGHLHVILDDTLISMTQGTTQLIPNLTPGQHLLKVEFVASDHLPFNPRVIAAVAFEVKK